MSGKPNIADLPEYIQDAVGMLLTVAEQKAEVRLVKAVASELHDIVASVNDSVSTDGVEINEGEQHVASSGISDITNDPTQLG